MAYSLISKKEIKEHASDAAKQFFSCPHVVESPKHTRDISMGIHKPIGDVTIVMSCLSFIIGSGKAYPVPFGSHIIAIAIIAYIS